MRAHMSKLSMQTNRTATTMEAPAQKKPRQPNFTAADCLLLAELMGEDCGVEGLTFHAYAKHKYTPSITAVTKHEVHLKMANKYNMRADVKRDEQALQKKWDNLTQIHRSCYADHRHSMGKTGGGPAAKPLSPLTEAIIAVIGKNSQNTIGIHGTEELDSSQLHSTQFLSQYNNSTDMIHGSRSEGSLMNRNAFNFSDNYEEALFPIDSIDIITEPILGTDRPSGTKTSSTSIEPNIQCCMCGCHKTVDELKKIKMSLQIKIFKKELGIED